MDVYFDKYVLRCKFANIEKLGTVRHDVLLQDLQQISVVYQNYFLNVFHNHIFI